MRWIVSGLVSLAMAACSCTQPPESDPHAVSISPEPAPPMESEAEVASPEPEQPPLPAGPVVTAATDAAHARAQAQLLRSSERLPPLRPASERKAATLADLAPAASPETMAIPSPVGMSAMPPEEAMPDEGSGVVPVPEGMPGYFVPVTDPRDGDALASFHAALQGLAEGRDPDGKVRVAMYGASGTAADLAVGYVRTYLQARFGDGGPGFVPLMPLSGWYRHNEVVVEASKGWNKEHAQIRKGRQDGHYGLLGASFTATAKKRWGQVRPKKRSTSSQAIAHVELMFLRQPGGGSFRVSIDGAAPQTVSTAGDEIGPGYHSMEVEPGPHTVRVETVDDAEVRVFGVVLERDEPGVVVDVLGIDGTRGRNHLTWNEELWADNLRRRAPDLYTLSYGTNESVDEDLSIPIYAEDLRAQLRRFRRVLPESSCLLLGPVDFPIVQDGEVMPRPLLDQIIEVQRQVAFEEGCGFWDGVEFMGGKLSMATWVHTEPPLARSDHLHFNRRGAARKGMALADALLHGFDARRMAPADGPSRVE